MNTQTFRTLIEVSELTERMIQSDLVILDCRLWLMEKGRGRKEYLQGHIPGAFYMDPEVDLSSPAIQGVTGRHPLPHPEVVASAFRAAGIHASTQVVVYDQSSGAFAARAWWILRWLGHDQVAILNGGMEAWLSAGLEIDNQWPPPKAGTFEPHLRPELIVDKTWIAAHPQGIYDSRDYRRYTGEIEPIDPVAGHIEGAVCIPHADNTNADGKWKPLEALQERFANIHSSDLGQPIFYCGSGITACQNIFAYKIATGKDALLYPGSWSEWIHYYPAATGA